MKTKFTTLIILSSILCITKTEAQRFQRTIEFKSGLTYMTSWGNSIQQTPDSGYIITGASGANPNYNPFLLKTDMFGTMQWYKIFSSNLYEGRKVKQTSDSGYVVAGSASSNGNDAFLMKTDANGNVQWAKTYGGSSWDDAYDVKQTADGGFIFTGITRSFGSGNNDVYLVKTNSSGDTLWTRTFGGTDWDWGKAVVELSDGNYMVGGYTQSFGSGYKDIYLLKINPGGNLLWTKTLGDTTGSDQDCVDMILTLDNHLLLLGHDGNPMICKMDTAGTVLWSKIFTSAVSSLAIKSVSQNSDSTYIVAGTSQGSTATWSFDAMLAKFTSTGGKIWLKTYGGSNEDNFNNVIQTEDGGFAAVGNSSSFGGTYIMKGDTGALSGCSEQVITMNKSTVALTASTGGSAMSGCNINSVNPSFPTANIVDSVVCMDSSSALNIRQILSSEKTGVKIFPNPFSSYATLVIPDEMKNSALVIYYILGNEVRKSTVTNTQSTIEKGNLSEGIYFYQLKNTRQVLTTGKFVVNN